jgi:hypothetical protein
VGRQWLASGETRILFLDIDGEGEDDLWLSNVKVSQGYVDSSKKDAMVIKAYFSNSGEEYEKGEKRKNTHWERVFWCARR